MNFLIDNWYILIGIISLLLVCGVLVYKFFGLPTKEQVIKIKEWLLYAVTITERELGSGTGNTKLRFAYDMFITKFPITAKLVSFETFSKWVDDSLIIMKEELSKNIKLQQFVQPQ